MALTMGVLAMLDSIFYSDTSFTALPRYGYGLPRSWSLEDWRRAQATRSRTDLNVQNLEPQSLAYDDAVVLRMGEQGELALGEYCVCFDFVSSLIGQLQRLRHLSTSVMPVCEVIRFCLARINALTRFTVDNHYVSPVNFTFDRRSCRLTAESPSSDGGWSFQRMLEQPIATLKANGPALSRTT